MAEQGFKALTPLGQAAPQSVQIGAVGIVEEFGSTLASLAARRGQEAAVAAAAAQIGLPLPGPGKAASGPEWSAFWLAPQQWMIEADSARHEDIVAALKPAFGEAASITEQTGGWARFDPSGPGVHRMFERLCALNTTAMQPGDASRTVIEHLGCYVICRAPQSFSVLGPRSSALSLQHALMTAAKSAQ